MGDRRVAYGRWLLVSACVAAGSVRAAHAGVNVELRPASQTANVGDTVQVALFGISAGGGDQPVGFFGAVVVWDAAAMALTGHDDTGSYPWTSSSFPSDPAGVNGSFLDGDAYYQATVSPDGPYAAVSAAGSLITTLRFTALSSAQSLTSIRVVPCIGATCTRVLDRHPFDGGVTEVTGTIGPAVEVTILCQTPAQCDDANPCTDDACSTGSICTHTPNDAVDPSDGLFCNGHEVCSGGQIIVEPGTFPDCNDGQPCTADSCNETADQCDHVVAAGSCLIDGACRVDGTVNPGNECEACVASVSQGAWTPRPAGVACGNPANAPCDLADTCDGSGACQGNVRPAGAPCGSNVSTVCTGPDTCDGAGACLVNHAPNGTACDDGLFCTPTENCQEGQCAASGTACPGQVCDESVDRCKSVGIEFRPSSQGPVAFDTVVEVGLYAVSATGVDQAISAVSAVVAWDPARLELLGILNNGPVNWLVSALPDDSGLDGLNNTFLDGDALYQASTTPNPNPPALATTGGLLITTFRFRAFAAGSASIRLVPMRGGFSKTQVTDAETIGLDITGAIGPPVSVTIVRCLVDADCDDAEFCNGAETCANDACVAGLPPQCDDNVFCNGPEFCQFGVGCVTPGNPCPEPASCEEGTGTCGGCGAPTIVAAGSRYLAVTPRPGSDPLALLFTGDPGGPAVACLSRYAQGDGTFGAQPVFRTPASWGTVLVHGLEVRPFTRYAVQADCRPQGAGYVSNKAFARTWVWGDVNGDGAAGIDDITLMADGMQGLIHGGATQQSLDLSPCAPDGVIDSQDMADAQAAFSGTPFPCEAPCPVCVVSAPPQHPVGVAASNRYLAFTGGNPGVATAVRVTLTSLPPPFDVWNGRNLWVGPPVETSELPARGFNVPPTGEAVFWAATLQCEPSYRDWSQFAAVHVHDQVIVPSRLTVGGGSIAIPSTYTVEEIESRCDVADGVAYSVGMSVTMSAFGDVAGPFAGGAFTAPDARVDVAVDVVAALLKFAGASSAPIKARADLEPASPDGKINITDVLSALNGFAGMNYSFTPGAFPCP